MGDIIALAISGVFVFFVVLGFLVGLIRGFKKTLIRTIFIVGIGIVLMFVTTKIPFSLVKADITWIPGIEGLLQGASTIEEFLSITITNSVEGVSAEQVQPLVSLAVSIASMLISGILFLVLFILLKYLSLPIYWIVNAFIGRSKKGKHRMLGGLLGAILGVIIFTFITTPIVGYVNIVNKIDEIPINGLTPALYQASVEDENNGGILGEGPIGEVITAIDNSIVLKVYNSIGIQKLQLEIFNQTSAVKINDETIKINNEIDTAGNVIVKVIALANGPVDFSDINAVLSNPDQMEYLADNIPDVLSSLFESKIFAVTLDTAMPILSEMIEKTVTDSLIENPSIDPTLSEPLTNLLTDLFDGLANSKSQDILMIFDSVIEVATIYPKISTEEGIKSLTSEDFGKVGGILDSFIDSELVKQETIGELVPAILDLSLKSAGNGGEVPEVVTTLIDDLKQSFASGEIVYANELKTIGELVSTIMNLEISEETTIDGALLKSLGASLDKAFSYDSKILTRNLVDDLVIGLLDMAAESDNPELENYGEIFELVKKPFENHEITCYENEFEAFGEIVDYALSLGSAEELNLVEIGEKLDSVLEKDSKIINRELVNSVVSVLADDMSSNFGEELKPALEKIEEKLSITEVSFAKEFGAIQKLLDTFENNEGDELDLEAVGKTLDEIILESDILDHEVIGLAVSVFIEGFANSTNEELKPALEKIEEKITTTEISFEKEFGCIQKLLDTINGMEGEELDLEAVGKTLDEIILESEILDREVIGLAVSVFIDGATDELSEEFKPTIEKIEDKIINTEISFEKEFGVMQKLLDTIKNIDGENLDLSEVGKTLDEITLESEIIDHEVIGSTVSIFVDRFTNDVGEEFKPTIEKIEERIGDSDISFEKEFGSIQKLLDTIKNINNTDLEEVGKTLDEITLESEILDHEVINQTIVVLIDELSSDLDAKYKETIDSVKAGFTGNDLVYENEFKALDKLLDTIEKAGGANIDLVEFGKDIDYILTNLQSKVITRDIVNSSIQVLIDDAIEVEEEYQKTIEDIKQGFNRNDLVYETEFTAIDKLLDVLDRAIQNDVSLSVFGKELDDILALNSKIITKQLINEFIATSFETFVKDEDIAQAGSLIDPILNIKVRIVDINYQIKSYKTEFTAIDKIIEIASVAGNLSIKDMDKKLFDGNTKTIGEVFDDKIKDSVLIGDCGIGVIDSLIDSLNDNNIGDENFFTITNIISKNFNAIKPRVKCASNKNLTQLNVVTYSQLANAFVEIEHYLEDSTHKVTGQTEFTLDIASYYEESLENMQNNILLDKNGTRAVASYICDEIANVLEDKAQTIANPMVADVIRSYKDVILTYKQYLKRPETLDNNKLNEKECYSSTGSSLYVTSTDGFITNITFTNTKPSTSYAYISKPFTSIASQIGEYL